MYVIIKEYSGGYDTASIDIYKDLKDALKKAESIRDKYAPTTKIYVAELKVELSLQATKREV